MYVHIHWSFTTRIDTTPECSLIYNFLHTKLETESLTFTIGTVPFFNSSPDISSCSELTPSNHPPHTVLRKDPSHPNVVPFIRTFSQQTNQKSSQASDEKTNQCTNQERSCLGKEYFFDLFQDIRD